MAAGPASSSRFRLAKWLKANRPDPRADGALVEDLRRQLAQRESALDEARRQADEARATRREFLAAMNHELRTPLNAILGFGQVLDMSPLSDDQRDSLRQVLKGGRHLLHLVNELLEISQLDAGSLDLSPEPVGVSELLADLRDLVQPWAADRGVTLQMPVEAGAGVWVRADRHRLKQVLLNLLSNAIKFNHPRGRVDVRITSPDSTRVRFAVSDTGPGLSPDEVQRLFAPFERLDAANQGIEGTGLGLTLCRGLLKRMDGAIGVESTRGQGATFWIDLPATVEVATPTVLDAQPAGPTARARRQAPGLVLHIEDNSTNLRLIERLLATRPGVRVLAAMQGRLGLDLAREQQPALILLDLNLPDTHGLDVLRRLSGDPRTAAIPVVIVTGRRLARPGPPRPRAGRARGAGQTGRRRPVSDRCRWTADLQRRDAMPTRLMTEARILVVDDQESNVQLLDRLLRMKGYAHIETLTDSRQTVDRFVATRPDLVCLDLRMPHMSGLEVLEELQPLIGAGDYVPILILTADTAPETKQTALSMGAKDFLNKPFDAVEALLRIHNLLETRFLYLELRAQNERLDQKVRERTRELEEAQHEILARLALAAEYRDDQTGEHTRRVGHLAALLARELGLTDAEVELIRQAAPLHDIGKIGIPDAVLMKPGRLTPAEFEVMKTHTEIGARLLSGSRFPLLRLAQEVARTHHEWWNGNGYLGLEGEQIPLASRIVTVADTFDAITHDRPYRAGRTIRMAIEELRREAGRQFDPVVVEAIARVLESEMGFDDGQPAASFTAERASSSRAALTRTL